MIEKKESIPGLTIKIPIIPLWLLLSFSHPGIIYGFNNPFSGWLRSEIDLETQKGIVFLLENRFIFPLSYDQYTIRETVLPTVQTIVEPKNFVFILEHASGIKKRLYFKGNSIIKCTSNGSIDIKINSLNKTDALLEFLPNILVGNKKTKFNLTLNSIDYEKIKEISSGEQIKDTPKGIKFLQGFSFDGPLQTISITKFGFRNKKREAHDFLCFSDKEKMVLLSPSNKQKDKTTDMKILDSTSAVQFFKSIIDED